MTSLDVSGCVFAPVIHLPEAYEVYDFTAGYDPERAMSSRYGVGRYDEKRRGMYTTALFAGTRDVHVGVDIAAPVGEGVHAFWDGVVHRFGENPAAGDYGFTLVTQHEINGRTVWALHGHLSARSVEGRYEGSPWRAARSSPGSATAKKTADGTRTCTSSSHWCDQRCTTCRGP